MEEARSPAPASAAKERQTGLSTSQPSHPAAQRASLEESFASAYSLSALGEKAADASNPRGRSEITAEQRARMVDWMFEAATKLVPDDAEAAISVFCRAVLLMDLFVKHCATRTLTDADVHLLGLVCLFLAGKYEDLHVRLALFAQFAAHGVFTPGEICAVEAEVLFTLGFNVSFPSPFDLLRAALAEARTAGGVAGVSRRLAFEASPASKEEEAPRDEERAAAEAALTELDDLLYDDVYALAVHALLLTLHDARFNDFSPVHRVLACAVCALRRFLRLALRLPALRTLSPAAVEAALRARPFPAALLSAAEAHLQSRYLVPCIERFLRDFRGRTRGLTHVARHSVYAPTRLRLLRHR